MQKLKFKENLDNIKDILDIKKEESIRNKNYIRVIDADTNKVLISRRDNIITLRGRTFALEKLYEDTNNSLDYPIKNFNRKINLFSVGSGGCPTGDPFSPIIPSPLDISLANRIPFVSSIIGDNSVDLDVYPVSPESVDNVEYFYYKRFNILDPEWCIDLPTNTVYKKLELLIDIQDCRDENINELSLYFSSNTFTQPEMYSRVTFPTEHISGSKKVLVEYYTFA